MSVYKQLLILWKSFCFSFSKMSELFTKAHGILSYHQHCC